MPGNPQNLLVSIELVSSNGQEMGVEAEKDELYVSGGKMLFGRTLQQNVIALLQLAALVRRYDLLSLKRLEGKSTHKNPTSLLHGVGVAA